MGNCNQNIQAIRTDKQISDQNSSKRSNKNLQEQNVSNEQTDETPLQNWLKTNRLESFHVNSLSNKTNDVQNRSLDYICMQKSNYKSKKSQFSKFSTQQIKNSQKELQKQPKKQRANTYQPIQISVQTFITVKKAKLSDQYSIICKIGEGSYGNVYKGKCKLTGQYRAIKALKSKFMKSGQKSQLMAEMNILKRLDHPNIIKLYEIIQSKSIYYIIMEYCDGGQVFKALYQQNDYNELVVATIMKQLLGATFYMHQKRIIHRDLKLQNLVFQKFIDFSTADLSQIKLKIIDFGLAVNLRDYRRKKQLEVAGSLPYISPQGRVGKICNQSDIWSCGIILCIMLTGQNPLINKGKVIEQINLSPFFQDPIWDDISYDAKKLAMQMLKINPTQRITAQQALKHKWITSFAQASTKKITSQHRKIVLDNLSNYQRGDNFVAMIHSFLAFKRITQQQRQQLADLFQRFDKDGSGTIDYTELIQCYTSIFGQQSNVQAQQILKQVDSNNSGQIDFSQFIKALYNKKKLFKLEALKQAFNYYDKNKSGFLQKKQLKELLQGTTNKQVSDLFLMIDIDADNKISFQQFANYLQKN